MQSPARQAPTGASAWGGRFFSASCSPRQSPAGRLLQRLRQQTGATCCPIRVGCSTLGLTAEPRMAIMNEPDSFTAPGDARGAFERDGVVCLRGVIDER